MKDSALVDVPVHPAVFWRAERAPGTARLAGARCRRCAEAFFPPRRACPRCHSAEWMEARPLATHGRVFALTHVVRPAPHYAQPYLLALVDLADGVRVMAQLKVAPDAVRVGDEVVLVVEPLFETADGHRVWGYRFAPLAAAAR